MSQIEFLFNLPLRVVRRRHWVVAQCPPLDIASQGETVEEAKRNLAEATRVFLVSCYERGTIEAVLKECGFEPQNTVPARRPAARNRFQVSLPLRSPAQDQCRA